MKRDENFSEWYNDVIERAGLTDKRYPIKGMNIWLPFGWSIMQHIDDIIRGEVRATAHSEINFPLLVPESQFKKEEEHIKGFGGDIFWVTHAGTNVLEEKLALRPTSEAAMYSIFSLWIRSHADLPLKVFQIVNAFRYETKQTRSFIRVREIHFFEAHTCHATFEDAERQIAEDLGMMSRIARKLCLPYLINRRPEWDKFPGSLYSIGCDVVMPDKKTLQIGTIHQYKDNFSRAYEISYETDTGEHTNVHQTTYGMSERLLGAIIGIHGDDKGLKLPPAIAPQQITIIPIIFKDSGEDVMAACTAVRDTLAQAGYRASIDDRASTPGSKYFDWELRGVPVRIDIGPRDLKNGVVCLVRRDTGEKSTVTRDDLIPAIEGALASIEETMLAQATTHMESSITFVQTLDEARGQKGVVTLGWCGSDACAETIEKTLDVKTLGTPVKAHDGAQKQCATCGGAAQNVIYVSRMY